ncbi:AAA family ATPase [Rhodococcus sp. BP-252]|uniref:AAA domain-containing protein n=1 Tax=unclassified Rhodococcus (in: high G+C Gram-positive bacteria) TaxID=192944 RepID=UPI001C9B8178|nr:MULTISPECIES: AAA domain-containing protein [unclassified Rhodococcus (in: high G+C Gram-positive bacteria)]MBY6414304.1 AAA family ATPase [Rhodococcus sp. BP-320]MBY6419043.1 AAA family ATPase [Rhodococcus sp. BP-321]MBY6423771.1 AAA family ATPase [Rhodococcus sp. BP-324]MBY6429077.1 AAA family ATPase [Rhodococcus sp. BP-323]MBY6434083.1 AAA family ATPase [Rhodococcus sp. BP-322]
MSLVDDDELRGRVRRLLEFLRETVGAQSKPIRSYGTDARIEWLFDDSRPLDVNTDVAPGDVAVRIPRTSIEQRPSLPRGLADHVDESTTPPTVKPDALAEAQEWLRQWHEWSLDDQQRRPFAELFRSVDLMLHDLGAQPESLELVIASGYLDATIGGQQIATHLITQQASISREESTGDLLITVAPASSPRLEDVQVLLDLDGFDRAGSKAQHRRLSELITSSLSADIPKLLGDWATSALKQPLTVIADHDKPANSTTDTLRMSPALVLRKRGSYALMSYYDAMIAALDNGAPVPVGLSHLVEGYDDNTRRDWLEAQISDTPSAEPLFPLPANRAQQGIYNRVMNDTGVVVEGPPGTGKTHTIANLMSALMAQGQRILVTSEKAQALRVLKDKLPVELQDLCVSVTDMARGGSAELDESVSTIASRKASFDPAESARRIKSLAGKRVSAQEERRKIKEQMRVARSSEADIHSPLPTYTGTLATIIGKLNAQHDELGWIPGPLHSEQAPLDDTSFASLFTVRAGGPNLPPAEHIRALSLRAHSSSSIAGLDDIDPTQLHYIFPSAHALTDRARSVESFGPTYTTLADGLLSGALGSSWSRAQTVSAMLSVAVSADAAVGSHQVVATASRQALNAFDAAARLHESGQAGHGSPKSTDLLDAGATVDGVPTASGSELRLVAEHIRALVAVDDASNLLRTIGIELPSDGGTRTQRVETLHRVWNQVLATGSLASARDELVSALGAVVPSLQQVTTLADAIALASEITGLTDRSDAASARAELNALADRIAAEVPNSDYLIVALRTADPDAYERLAADLQPSVGNSALLETLAAQAPSLARAIDDGFAPPTSSFAKAWAWRWTRQWVESVQQRDQNEHLDAELDAIDEELSSLTAQLAAEQAWQECLQRMTNREVTALRAYQENMSNAGLGTNALAQRYRVAARAAMKDAQTVVPAWVMPIAQVLSSIPPQQNAFDVVIVDEASQSEVTSLLLMWLAPKIILVGDEKQCAPPGIKNYTLQSVLDRLDDLLPDVPISTRMMLTPKSSLFTLQRAKFGDIVRMREHYRSMPEIIEWSSTQFYEDMPLVPVRQFGADRLMPLRSTLVDGATTAGSSTRLTNAAEAQAVVDQLVQCLADPNYAGKTFGIAVLQGAAQANLIQSLVFERVPAEQREERRIRIGTPPEFQGDERDVMFLSMVVAPGTSFNALTADLYKRRFNVAASRARDQLWLFHSVTVDDLSPTDLRRSLLSYVEAAPTIPVPAVPESVSATTRHPDFGSLFEQQVFLALRERGYHVNPRVEVNGMAIDLVVTGAAVRVAIECDDDSDVDADELMDRMEREFELRRSGWLFHRVRASDFALDRERVLDTITEILDSVGLLRDEVEVVIEGSGATAWSPIALVRDADDTEVDDEVVELGTVDTPVPSRVDVELAPLPEVIETVDESEEPDDSGVGEVEDVDDMDDVEPAPTPARVMPREDLIAAIRYSQKKNMFSVAQTVEELDVTVEAVHEALAEIKSRDDALRAAKKRPPGPTPDMMPRRRPVVAEPSIVSESRSLQAELDALKVPSWPAARQIAVAAARPNAPLTIERCQRVTGFSSAEAEKLLWDLLALKKLVRRKRDGVEEWVRPQGLTL